MKWEERLKPTKGDISFWIENPDTNRKQCVHVYDTMCKISASAKQNRSFRFAGLEKCRNGEPDVQL